MPWLLDLGPTSPRRACENHIMVGELAMPTKVRARGAQQLHIAPQPCTSPSQRFPEQHIKKHHPRNVTMVKQHKPTTDIKNVDVAMMNRKVPTT